MPFIINIQIAFYDFKTLKTIVINVDAYSFLAFDF